MDSAIQLLNNWGLVFCYLLRAERTMGIDNDDVFKMAEGGGIDDVGW